jgi:hypothetical protein
MQEGDLAAWTKQNAGTFTRPLLVGIYKSTLSHTRPEGGRLLPLHPKRAGQTSSGMLWPAHAPLPHYLHRALQCWPLKVLTVHLHQRARYYEYVMIPVV